MLYMLNLNFFNTKLFWFFQFFFHIDKFILVMDCTLMERLFFDVIAVTINADLQTLLDFSYTTVYHILRPRRRVTVRKL